MCDILDHQNMLFNLQNLDLFVHPFFRHFENSNLISTTLVDLKKEPQKGLDRQKINRCYEINHFFHSMNINYCQSSIN